MGKYHGHQYTKVILPQRHVCVSREESQEDTAPCYGQRYGDNGNGGGQVLGWDRRYRNARDGDTPAVDEVEVGR